MENIDKLQTQFENLDKLIDALLPFVPFQRQGTLRSLHYTLEPMKHIKDIFNTMEMVRSLQEVMGNDQTPDLSKLSGFLSPEQLQMFEMFQTMQDINL